jgi:hypothetical protein
MSKNNKSSNLKLAALFILLVFGLIILSLFIKVIFVFRDSKFDGSHNFIIEFQNQKQTKLVSFSPQGKTISIVDVHLTLDKRRLSKTLDVPIDAVIKLNNDMLQSGNISTILLKSLSLFSKNTEGLTTLDVLRLSLFAKSVSSNSIYEKDLSANLTDAQKSTVLSLSFSDPAIFSEGQSIQIINASESYGLGARLANLITNIGGNPVLVTTADKPSKESKIIYYQDESYTVKKLSNYLDFPVERSGKRNITDVIIIIGQDKINNLNF